MPERTSGLHEVALSLGGNLGNSVQFFRQAIQALSASPNVSILRTSSVWRTSPWGKTDQPDFLNMALVLQTGLQPLQLLTLCQAIENAAGRTRAERWGPRSLDIDVISFSDVECTSAEITLPHPRAHERAFVLAPLAEIASGLVIQGRTIHQWLAHVRGQQSADKTEGICLPDNAATARLLSD